MKEESVVYVKLEYEEALESKKDILSSQVGLLKTIQAIRHYKTLRLEELKIKQQMHRKVKEIITSIKNIYANLPEIKIPQFKKDEEEKNFGKKIKEAHEEDEGLEIQLQEIQNKLRDIGG